MRDASRAAGGHTRRSPGTPEVTDRLTIPVKHERHEPALSLEAPMLGELVCEDRFQGGGKWKAPPVAILRRPRLKADDATRPIHLSPLQGQDLALEAPARQIGEANDRHER